MGAIARKTFTANGNFTAPAGVNVVRLIGSLPAPTLAGSTFFGNQTMVIAQDGLLYAWGTNSSGGCGSGGTTNISTPTQVLNSATIKFLNVTGTYGGGGDFGTYGISQTLDMYAWGGNGNGNLGQGNLTPYSSPVMILGGLKFVQVIAMPAGGGSYSQGTFMLTSTGVAYAMGANINGQLGVGDVVSRSSPVAVLGGLSFASLYAAWPNQSAFGLTAAGKLYAWGGNANGNLGIGNVTPQSSPIAVLGSLSFSQIIPDQAAASMYGLTTTGLLYAWGLNTNGQLGVGDVIPRSSPVAVLGGLSFTQVVAGNSSVMALATNGTTYAWGNNANGQLGTGNVTPTSSPVAVLNSASLLFTQIANNYNSSSVGASGYGLTAAGVLYAWGVNASGQLGTGNVTPTSSPVAVLGSLSFSQIFSANSAAIGTMYGYANNQLYAWGYNLNGQVGDGTAVAKSSPVAVLNRVPNLVSPQTVMVLPVTPGTTYAVNIGTQIRTPASFGSTNLGQAFTSVVVEYEQ